MDERFIGASISGLDGRSCTLTSSKVTCDLGELPAFTTVTIRTVVEFEVDAVDPVGVSIPTNGTLVGNVAGTDLNLMKPGSTTTASASAVEYLFLAGLGALAAGEYLEQRRKRKRSVVEVMTADVVLEEITDEPFSSGS
jgi:hypothetical protein